MEDQEYKKAPQRQIACPGRLLVSVVIISILAIMPFLGCQVGMWFYRADLESADQWKLLNNPPERIEKLLDADFDTVYAEMVDHKTYSCYRGSQYDMDCWIEVAQVPELYRLPCNNPTTSLAPSPPGQVVDSLQVEYCHRFGRTEFDYVLLEDGSVWQWGYDDFHWSLPPKQALRLMRSACCGSFVGLAIGITLCVVVFRAYVQRTKVR